jgi:hypothetical protein
MHWPDLDFELRSADRPTVREVSASLAPTTTMRRALALTRLPMVVFPASPLTLRVRAGSERCAEQPLSVPAAVLSKCEADGGGLLATVPFGDSGLGVHLQLMSRTDELAHFTVTDRVRFAPLSSTTNSPLLLNVHHDVLPDRADLDGSPEQRERCVDEAALVRSLVALGERAGTLPLDLGLDELGVEHAELCRHPQWAASKVMPKEAHDLSFWLPARLPFTTELKARFLFAFSSLWRLQSAVDAIRFLSADALHDGRYSHRFVRIVDSPATDICGRGIIARPRVTIGSAADSRATRAELSDSEALAAGTPRARPRGGNESTIP